MPLTWFEIHEAGYDGNGEELPEHPPLSTIADAQRERDSILSVRGVAAFCGVEQSTVKKWLISGKLKGSKLNAWTWLITQADLDAALTNGTIRKSPGRGRRPIAILGQKPLK